MDTAFDYTVGGRRVSLDVEYNSAGMITRRRTIPSAAEMAAETARRINGRTPEPGALEAGATPETWRAWCERGKR